MLLTTVRVARKRQMTFLTGGKINKLNTAREVKNSPTVGQPKNEDYDFSSSIHCSYINDRKQIETKVAF